MDSNALVSMKDITKMTTLASPSIYRLIKENRFPPGKMITANRRVWRRDEVEEAIERLLDEAE
ncbi:helix-turn-helix transcriptional regulator [Endozoicomonas acroporae]|uniref:helix-turn-helix transcriptional regulator n=1 Tax=Endozoicomonas acroporae TaxID=1701104 RepID=UPI0013D039D9|nr:AlpA family phage regulatory protein [Endozoicomonas acroporae]